MNYNNAINPREDTFPVEVMPSRSSRIKKVTARQIEGPVGGCTDPATGQVWIPTGNTAKERTIRYHEALHAEFTPSKAVPRDILDQALEDGRLHRHCSVSAESKYFQARRDELCMALRELRQGLRLPVTPISNVVLFRSLAILSASSIKDSHARLLDKCFARRGKGALDKFTRALELLSDYANLDKARALLGPYFTDEMAGGKAPSKPMPLKDAPKPDKDDTDKDEDTTPSKASDTEDDTDDSESESDSDSEDESDSDSDSTGEDTREDEEEDDTDSDSDSDTEAESGRIAPATDTRPTKARPVHPDKYTADLTPECDKEAYESKSATHPLELRIRRLDMGINRVKLSLGRKAPLPVTSGRQILARKLASVRCNPTMRIFTRPVNQGGYGTILIDASSSMSIPESTLIEFLDKAPALTIAFYNAPSDVYGTTHGKSTHGNLYIYAANGYRASMSPYSVPEYSYGNLIDYQAMCWLIKQPSPHYLVTDQGWTGPWKDDCNRLFAKLTESKQIVWVRNLETVEELLEARSKVR